MKKFSLAIALICGLLSSAPAGADWIKSDNGGRIGEYKFRYDVANFFGEQFTIDGPCLSACTLITGLVPRDRVCVTRHAVLGFHQASVGADARTIGLRSEEGTRALMATYPRELRSWIRHRGGLRRKMIFMRGAQLRLFYRPCT